MKKIIVIKIGRNVATTKRNKLDLFRFEQFIKQIKLLHEYNIGVVFIVSAGVSCGEQLMKVNGMNNLCKEILGGIGQTYITSQLNNLFQKQNLNMAQLLVTKHDFKNIKKRETIARVIQEAIRHNIIILMNENDIVELHSFKGNDYLASKLAKLVRANHLLLLTDVNGILDQEMKVINFFLHNKKLKIATIKKINSKGEIGGIKSKINAATKACEQGINTWIANGKSKNLLIRLLLKNEHLGTKVI